MNIHFILVEPQVPENIGASARAIKTMGFSLLRLVNPNGHKDLKAKMLAHGSIDILDNARIFNSLNEAVSDLDFKIATTAKKRSVKQDYIRSDELLAQIQSKGNTINNIGIVFGREESGLTNDEIALCDITSSVPMNNLYPSLNLSQAVMVYAYSLAELNIVPEQMVHEAVNDSEYFVLKSKIGTLLDKIKITENPNITTRIFERLSLLSKGDIHLMLSVLKKLEDL